MEITGTVQQILGGESGGPKERRLVRLCNCWVNDDARECDGWPSCGTRRWMPTDGGLAIAQHLRDQCQEAGVPFMWKQWGGPHNHSGGRLLDGRTWDEMPRVAVPA